MKVTTLPGGVKRASAIDQIDSGIAATLNAADTTMAGHIRSLSLVHQARVSRLARSAASVAEKHGARSSQAKAAQAAVTAAQTNLARIDLIYRQITAPVPQVTASGWVLHGRVYDAQLQPVAGYSVFLVDNQKNYQTAYGFANTDSTGYFLISYDSNTVEPPCQTASPSTNTTALFVQITNSSGVPVYLSATAFQPAPGNATYQNIILTIGEPVPGGPIKAVLKPLSVP